MFDEIFNHCVDELLRKYRYINNNENKFRLGAGDVHQLEAVESSTNLKDNDTHVSSCVNMMFPHMIEFNDMKRIQNKEQIPIDKHMYDELFHVNKHVNHYIEK